MTPKRVNEIAAEFYTFLAADNDEIASNPKRWTEPLTSWSKQEMCGVVAALIQKALNESSRNEADQPTWRDPKDKPAHLPGEHHSEDVLLLMKDWTEPVGKAYRIGHVSLGHWRPNGGNGNFDDDVLAWMPLPSAPEGKG